jgi:hypothetical protein
MLVTAGATKFWRVVAPRTRRLEESPEITRTEHMLVVTPFEIRIGHHMDLELVFKMTLHAIAAEDVTARQTEAALVLIPRMN